MEPLEPINHADPMKPLQRMMMWLQDVAYRMATDIAFLMRAVYEFEHGGPM